MELNKVLKTRKSVRKYDMEKNITDEQLEYILFAGMAAPISRKAYSSIKITVVQQKALLQELSDAFSEKVNPFYGAPTVIIVSSQQSEVKNIDCFNVACIIENMLLASTDLELGSIYLTSFLRSIENRSDLLKKLEIPEGYKPLSAVGVGYKINSEKEQEIEEIKKRIEVVRK